MPFRQDHAQQTEPPFSPTQRRFVHRSILVTLFLSGLALVPPLASVTGGLAVTLAGIVCTATCFARARATAHPADRWCIPISSGWFITGLGTATLLGSQVSWVVFVMVTGHAPAHVIAWVMGTATAMVLVALGLIALISRQRSDLTRRALDSVTVAGATCVVLWTVSSMGWINIPIARSIAPWHRESIPKLILVLALSFLFTVVAAIVCHRRHWRSTAAKPAIAWAIAGTSIFAVASLVDATSSTGMGPFTLALCSGLLCTAYAAANTADSAPVAAGFGYGLQPFWPHAALITSITLAAVQHQTIPDSDHVTVALLIFIGLVIVLRHHLTLNDNQQLVKRIHAREQQLATMAYRDDLTNLQNRRKFTTSLVGALASPAYDPVAVVFLDLDGFKGVNDTFGHASGDDILITLADRLRHAAPTANAIARIAGDEFAVLVPPDIDAEELAQRIVEIGREPFILNGERADVTCSVGVAIWHRDEEKVTAEQLLTRADQAMYDIKHRGRNNYRVFSTWLPDSPNATRALAPALAGAVATGQIRTHLQPLVDLRTGRIKRYESLARWEHEGVAMPPDRFIGIAENAGLLDRLTDRIVSQACVATRALAKHHQDEQVSVGVNIGAYSLRDRDLPARLLDTVSTYGVKPEQLYFEVTETLPMEDMDRAAEILCEMIESGLRVSLDDFGTGYNSLTQLLRLSVNAVKIDRSLVSECDRDPDARTILTGLVDLADHLEFEVIAEGVERLETAHVLADLGVGMAQGYYLGRPMPLNHWLAEPNEPVIAPLQVASRTLRTLRRPGALMPRQAPVSIDLVDAQTDLETTTDVAASTERNRSSSTRTESD